MGLVLGLSPVGGRELKGRPRTKVYPVTPRTTERRHRKLSDPVAGLGLLVLLYPSMELQVCPIILSLN